MTWSNYWRKNYSFQRHFFIWLISHSCNFVVFRVFFSRIEASISLSFLNSLVLSLFLFILSFDNISDVTFLLREFHIFKKIVFPNYNYFLIYWTFYFNLINICCNMVSFVFCFCYFLILLLFFFIYSLYLPSITASSKKYTNSNRQRNTFISLKKKKKSI